MEDIPALAVNCMDSPESLALRKEFTVAFGPLCQQAVAVVESLMP